MNNDGKLVLLEFCIAMQLIMYKKKCPGGTVPFTLPSHMVPTSPLPQPIMQAPPIPMPTPSPVLTSSLPSSVDPLSNSQGPFNLSLSRGSSFQNTPPLSIHTPPLAVMTPPSGFVGNSVLPPMQGLGQPAKGFDHDLQQEDETYKYKIQNILNAMKQGQELIGKEVATLEERKQRLGEAKQAEGQLKNTQTQQEHLREQLITFSARIESLVSESSNKGDKLKTQNANIQAEIDNLKAEQQQNTSVVANSVRVGEDAERHLAQLRSTLSEIDTALRNTGISVSDLESTVTHLRTAKRALEEEVEQQCQRFEGMLRQAREMTAQKITLTADIDDLENQLANIKDKAEATQTRQCEEKKILVELTTKHSELRREASSAAMPDLLEEGDREKYETSLKAIKKHLDVMRKIEEKLGVKPEPKPQKHGEWDNEWSNAQSTEWDKGFASPTVLKNKRKESGTKEAGAGEKPASTSWGFPSPSAELAFKVPSEEQWGFTPEQQKAKENAPPAVDLPVFDAPPIPSALEPAVTASADPAPAVEQPTGKDDDDWFS
eukprot:TRINITY_DN6544_c0_g1_i4.p1 TRINITY_DN6544_c0_g1~~TRINITY_DN6544_c0_g1_i4.p1  ORF type:complete len:546 (+),score=84.22 TRINITY_DN6544_c0_g1_i4:229-1866(+)